MELAEEYAVVFPAYYFGQIFEAKHEPGTVAYSPHMQLDLLQETTDEMGRNGCKKIVIVNGHGGNNHLLPDFAQTQMDSPHNYVVYIYWPDSQERNPPGRPALHIKLIRMRANPKLLTRWFHAPIWCTSTAPSPKWVRSKPARFARKSVHRNLVVCEVSRSLRRRRKLRQQTTGGV